MNSRTIAPYYLIAAYEELMVAVCAGGRGLIAGVWAWGGSEGGVEEEVIVVLRRARPGAALAVGLLDRKTVRAELPQHREPPRPDSRRHDPATGGRGGGEEEGDEAWSKRTRCAECDAK
jgi:hypothetical protein